MFMPWPPAGVWMCIASPASSTGRAVGAGRPAVAPEASQPGGIGHGDRPGARWSARCWNPRARRLPVRGRPRTAGPAATGALASGRGRPQPVRPERRAPRPPAAVRSRRRAVGDQPVLRVEVSVEGQAELAPDPAVRAVAADDVAGVIVRVGPPDGDGRGDGVRSGARPVSSAPCSTAPPSSANRARRSRSVWSCGRSSRNRKGSRTPSKSRLVRQRPRE